MNKDYAHSMQDDLIRRQDAIDALMNDSDWADAIPTIKSLPSAEPKIDGVFVKGGLTISGEPPMPEGCMDCKLQDRCLCIPPDLSADEISELYISRRPNCPLSIVEDPKTETVLCALADRLCPFQGKEYARCLTCPHISEEDRALVKKAVAEPKTGEWIRCKEQDEADLDNGNALYKCSNCGHTDLHSETQEVPYCWFCGSDMRGDKNG